MLGLKSFDFEVMRSYCRKVFAKLQEKNGSIFNLVCLEKRVPCPFLSLPHSKGSFLLFWLSLSFHVGQYSPNIEYLANIGNGERMEKVAGLQSLPYKSSYNIFIYFQLPLNFIFYWYRPQTFEFCYFFFWSFYFWYSESARYLI